MDDINTGMSRRRFLAATGTTGAVATAVAAGVPGTGRRRRRRRNRIGIIFGGRRDWHRISPPASTAAPGSSAPPWPAPPPSRSGAGDPRREPDNIPPGPD